MGLVYIASVTASASATVSFTTGIGSTYNEYQFHFVNMHPSVDSDIFRFQVNASGQTGFNEIMTTTVFRAYHTEANATSLAYQRFEDQAQGAGYQTLGISSSDADTAVSGVLTLYDPSSTTYVKHFLARSNGTHGSNISQDFYAAGYINTTSAIDEISFKMGSGNIDAGSIHMYGVG